MNDVVIYARYSSDKQNEISIEAQVRACKDYAAKHGLTVSAVYADEAISGTGSKTARRREYQRLLRDCERGGIHTILIHKYDRIARNLQEHVNLEAKLKSVDAKIVAVAQELGSGAGNEAKLFRAMLWTLSEYFVDNLSNETRKGLKERALKGLHTGGCAPFGWNVVGEKDNRHYEINELEAVYVRKMYDAAISGEGFTALIAEMAAAGITGKRGRPIKYPQIYEILRNEKYTGVYLYSPTEEKERAARREKADAIRVEGGMPAIISKDIWEEVQKIMTERKHTGKKGEYMCSGLVWCSCGAKMHATTNKRKGHEYHYFVCSAKCGAPVAHVEDVDYAAQRYVKELLTPERQEKLAACLRQYQAGEGDRMKEFKQVLKKRIREKQSQYDNLMKNLATGALPAEVAADVGEEMKMLKAEIEVLQNTQPPKDFTTDIIKSWLESIKKAPDKEAVKLLCKRIDVIPDAENAKTAFNMQSTLNTVLGEHGCGSAHHILPQILFRFILSLSK